MPVGRVNPVVVMAEAVAVLVAQAVLQGLGLLVLAALELHHLYLAQTSSTLGAVVVAFRQTT
jgi:hypothetical protein